MLDFVAMIAAAPSSDLSGEELDAEAEMARSTADRAGKLPIVPERWPGFEDGLAGRGGLRLSAIGE